STATGHRRQPTPADAQRARNARALFSLVWKRLDFSMASGAIKGTRVAFAFRHRVADFQAGFSRMYRFSIHVVPGRRQSVDTLCERDLEDHHRPRAKEALASGEVKLPHAIELFVVDLADLIAVLSQPLTPVAECVGVVLTQDFDVTENKAAALHHGHYFRKR